MTCVDLYTQAMDVFIHSFKDLYSTPSGNYSEALPTLMQDAMDYWLKEQTWPMIVGLWFRNIQVIGRPSSKVISSSFQVTHVVELIVWHSKHTWQATCWLL